MLANLVNHSPKKKKEEEEEEANVVNLLGSIFCPKSQLCDYPFSASFLSTLFLLSKLTSCYSRATTASSIFISSSATTAAGRCDEC